MGNDFYTVPLNFLQLEELPSNYMKSSDGTTNKIPHHKTEKLKYLVATSIEDGGIVILCIKKKNTANFLLNGNQPLPQLEYEIMVV